MANVNGTLAVSVNGYAAFTVAKIFATLKTVTIIRLATNFRYGLCAFSSAVSRPFSSFRGGLLLASTAK